MKEIKFGEGDHTSRSRSVWKTQTYQYCAQSSSHTNFQPQIELETTPVDLDTEVMQISKLVVNWLCALFFGLKASLELIEHRLPLTVRDGLEIPCGNGTLVRFKPGWIDERVEFSRLV